jgi:hypothetical protein
MTPILDKPEHAAKPKTYAKAYAILMLFAWLIILAVVACALVAEIFNLIKIHQ